MQPQKENHCTLNETAEHLNAEAKRIQQEAENLHKQAERLEAESKRIEAEAEEIKKHCKEDEKDLYIFVNYIRYDKHIKKIMNVNAIANLVGLSVANATVRRLIDCDDSSEPLAGDQKIKAGDKFVVTRKRVEGGFEDRIENEIHLLRESGQSVELVRSPSPYVIYKNVRIRGNLKIDIIVPVPNGYPAAMIDRAGLPAGSPYINQVKGSPQEIVQVAGSNWQLISYHPHAGGGGLPWDPMIHGFHTYLSEVLAWLEAGR